jgi:hypothetical protein
MSAIIRPNRKERSVNDFGRFGSSRDLQRKGNQSALGGQADADQIYPYERTRSGEDTTSWENRNDLVVVQWRSVQIAVTPDTRSPQPVAGTRHLATNPLRLKR